jgi:hypothetical protein
MSFNNNDINDDFSPSSEENGSELITRQNYEAYFLLYVDNELDLNERKAVEAFVEQNADLAEELVMLKQATLQPDEQIVFKYKTSLLQPVPESGPVNETNYEEYFVLYGDNELTNAEKELVEQFVYKHPQYQTEFELIQQVKLLPDNTLVYPDKNELYRTEEDRKVVPFPWRKLAVAAVLLLFMGGFGWYAATRNGGSNQSNPSLAGTNDTTTRRSDTNKDIAESGDATVYIKDTLVRQLPPVTPNQTKDVTAVRPQKNNTAPKRNISTSTDVQHKTRVLIPETAPQDRDLAANTVKMPVVNTERPVIETTVNERSLAATVDKSTIAYFEPSASDEDEIYVGAVSVNKSPLRGLFRKVTRVFDKATSIEPEENSKGGIRIASFSITRK